MRSILLLISIILPFQFLFAQAEGGIEQYHYIGLNSPSSVVPVVHMQSSKGWYGEARYNYDEQNTFSFLGGKTFRPSLNKTFSVTPMLGVSFGELHGLTGALNFSVEKYKFFANTQSQYTFSTNNTYRSFLFNWWELGYQPLDWLYGGLSFQHTQVVGEKMLFEPGIMAGLNFKKLSFPMYVFNTFTPNRFFVLGVNWEWQGK